MQINNKRHNEVSKTNLLPRLTNDEYETMMTCFVSVLQNRENLKVSTEDSKHIISLMDKITQRTIEPNTYIRLEGC